VDLRDRTLGRYLFVFRAYEPFQTTLLERAARPGAVAVDVGANIGVHTVLLGRRVGPGGRVIAFEPDPTSASLLRRSLAANRLGNVTCEEAAVMGRPGTVALHLSRTNFGDHRVFDGGDDARFNEGRARERISVRAVALDDYLDEAGIRPALLKMDIQGAEMAALPGMMRTLSDPGVVLFCEYWPYGLRLAGASPRGFLEALGRTGLTLFEMREEDRTVRPVDLDELAGRYPDVGLTNLIAVHPEGIRPLERALGVPLPG
jgi:FkbM family methyltransferase